MSLQKEQYQRIIADSHSMCSYVSWNENVLSVMYLTHKNKFTSKIAKILSQQNGFTIQHGIDKLLDLLHRQSNNLAEQRIFLHQQNR